jgi:oligosaccharide reducing-end xylanase
MDSTDKTVPARKYTNVFTRYGYSEQVIQTRAAEIWDAIFTGPYKIYTEVPPDMAYIEDVGNADVRTEGMSYGMMLAVQYDRHDVFDKLWRWVMKYMYMPTGRHAHYFAWSVSPEGVKNADGPAPDGEEYFAMALFFASRRWGEGEGLYAYADHARDILRHCVHNGDTLPGLPMWERGNYLIKFIPEADFTDPSYHLPHFYTLFAEYADTQDRGFWQQAAAASRAYLVQAINPETGLNPEYSTYTGEPYLASPDHHFFFSDAYRTSLNVALDAEWWGSTPVLQDRLEKLQQFFSPDGPGNLGTVYAVDGEAQNQTVRHPAAVLATVAAASLAVPASDTSLYFVDMFWHRALETGSGRYYSNLLYAFSFLALSGRYRMF